MSRRNRAQRVLAQPDPIYNSRLVTLLVARILKSGKKSVAQRIVYQSLEIISAKTEENPVLVLEKAVKNDYLLFMEHDANNELISLKKTEKGVRFKETFKFDSYF